MSRACVSGGRTQWGASAVLCIVGLVGSVNAQSIRCVALTGQQAPGVTAGATFASFDQPTISSAAGVVLRATLNQGAGGVTPSNDVAIWRFPHDGAAVVLAREGGAAAGIAGVTLTELGRPVADPRIPAVSYWARLGGAGISAANDRAIFLREDVFHFAWYQTGSPFFGTPEGTVAAMDSYRDFPTINAGGYATFSGTLSNGVPGAFAIDITTESIVLGMQGQQVPDLPAGVLFGTQFTAPVRDDIGDVAFKASLQHGAGGVDASNDQAILIRMATDGAYFRVARTGDALGSGHGHFEVFETISNPIVTDEPRVGFHATFRHGIAGIDTNNDAALCSLCPCGSIQLNLQEGTQANGQAPGVVFDSFTRPLFSRDSRMLFGAKLRGTGVTESNDSSIWWTNLPFDFVMAAREGMPAPGGKGATFADFNINGSEFWMGTSEHNQLVFTGRLSTGQRGLWVYTPSRGTRALVIEGQAVEVATGDTRPIASLAPITEGFTVQGRRSFISNDRQVVFQATVEGGQSGVFVADLPPVSLGCPSDWNNSETVNSQDFFEFLTDFFAGTADLNSSGQTDSQDMFDFLVGFFSGC